MSHFLNTRIISFDSPAKTSIPRTIASIMNFSWEKPEIVNQPVFTQTAAANADLLKHMYFGQVQEPGVDSDTVSIAHLRMIIAEMEAGRIKQDSVSMFTTKSGNLVIQMEMKRK